MHRATLASLIATGFTVIFAQLVLVELDVAAGATTSGWPLGPLGLLFCAELVEGLLYLAAFLMITFFPV